MTIQHLIDNGSAALAAFREQAATAQATAEQAEADKRVREWAKVLEPLYAALPGELHGHVDYDSTQMPTWRGFSGRVWIDAIPGCRVGVSDNSGTLRFYPQTAVRVVRNYYSDGGNAFRVEYENAYYDGYADPLVAIAHAVELAPANLLMEVEAKAQSEATAAKEALEEAEPSDQERIGNLIDEGKHIEAIARTLLWIATNLENR